jgi:hypothetical protein
MPPSDGKSARKRLGELLMQARVEMDLRYRNRALFARERGLNERLVQDVETGYRGGFRAPTKLAIEIAYGWEAGSFDAVMAGGEPVKTAVALEGEALDLITRAWGALDFAPGHIQRIWRSSRWTADQKLWLTRSYIEGDGNPGTGREELGA